MDSTRFTRRSLSPRTVALTDGVFFVWVALLMSADLKLFHSYIHWVFSLIPLLLMFPAVLSTRGAFRVPLIPGAFLLSLAILLAGFGQPGGPYSILQSVKIAVLLIYTSMFFLSAPRYAQIAFRGFLFAIGLNVVLVILGLLVMPDLAGMKGIGRWGTILNYPGSLWRVGITGFCYSAYLLSTEQRPAIRHVLLLSACLLLIVVDGSRTGGILVVLGALFLAAAVWMERSGHVLRLVTRMGVIGVVGGAVIMFALSAFTLGERSIIERLELLLEVQQSGGFENMAQSEVRYRMIAHALDEIHENPLWGEGIGTTTTPTSVGPMRVHNSYLQTWSDLGILGFVGYLCVVLGWIPLLPRALRGIQAQPQAVSRAVYYNAIFLLIMYALSGLFHPISTEWSEWIVFLVGYALVVQASGIMHGHNSGVPAS